MTTLTLNTTTQRLVLTPPSGPELVLTVQAAPQLVLRSPGTQGPPGPSAETVSRLAVGSVSALRVVSAVAGGVALADPASAASLACVLGIATTAAADGAPVVVRRSGEMTDPAWAWMPGLPIFCGASGVLTQTAPTSTASREIAVAISATSILVGLSDLIILE